MERENHSFTFQEHLQKTNGHLWKYGLFIPINVFQCSLWVTQLTTPLCFFAAVIQNPLSCCHPLKIFCFAMARSKALRFTGLSHLRERILTLYVAPQNIVFSRGSQLHFPKFNPDNHFQMYL